MRPSSFNSRTASGLLGFSASRTTSVACGEPSTETVIDPSRRAQVPVEAVVGRQPDGWVVVVDSRDGDVSGLVSAVAAGGPSAPPTLLAVTTAGEVLGTVTLADLSAAFSR